MTSRPEVLRQIPTKPLFTSVLTQSPIFDMRNVTPTTKCSYILFKYWIPFYVKKNDEPLTIVKRRVLLCFFFFLYYCFKGAQKGPMESIKEGWEFLLETRGSFATEVR